MNDIAHEVTKRLYGDDKVKCEILIHFLTTNKKVFDTLGIQGDEFTKSLSEGHLDGFMMSVVEHFEDHFNLEELAVEMSKNADRIPDIPMHVLKKATEICEDENVVHLADMENLDKNSVKKLLKRICE